MYNISTAAEAIFCKVARAILCQSDQQRPMVEQNALGETE